MDINSILTLVKMPSIWEIKIKTTINNSQLLVPLMWPITCTIQLKKQISIISWLHKCAQPLIQLSARNLKGFLWLVVEMFRVLSTPLTLKFPAKEKQLQSMILPTPCFTLSTVMHRVVLAPNVLYEIVPKSSTFRPYHIFPQAFRRLVYGCFLCQNRLQSCNTSP